MTASKQFHLYLVSDSTGETIRSVAGACLVQFEDIEPVEHFWNLVRSERQLAIVLEGVRATGGIVIFTLVDDRIRQLLVGACLEIGVPTISVLDPVIAGLGSFLGLQSQSRPGRQHALDAGYFSRIDAMDFAIAHDDGHGPDSWHHADVLLVGVSRTSKTPTALYLANRGVRAANVPLVPGVPLPAEVDQMTRPLIVGLTKDPDQLVQIRRNRLHLLNPGSEGDYVDPERVRQEVMEARRLFARKRWPMIDVSRRAIEETAAEILALLAQRGTPVAP